MLTISINYRLLGMCIHIAAIAVVLGAAWMMAKTCRGIGTLCGWAEDAAAWVKVNCLTGWELREELLLEDKEVMWK